MDIDLGSIAPSSHQGIEASRHHRIASISGRARLRADDLSRLGGTRKVDQSTAARQHGSTARQQNRTKIESADPGWFPDSAGFPLTNARVCGRLDNWVDPSQSVRSDESVFRSINVCVYEVGVNNATQQHNTKGVM
jgi:hypothetical protein